MLEGEFDLYQWWSIKQNLDVMCAKERDSDQSVGCFDFPTKAPIIIHRDEPLPPETVLHAGG